MLVSVGGLTFFNTRVHHITPVVNYFETIFKFTAITPVESNAAWLLACCRLDVFFYSIIEAALSRDNIVSYSIAGIFVYIEKCQSYYFVYYTT